MPFLLDMVVVYFEKKVGRAAAELSYFLVLTVFPILICINAFFSTLNLDFAELLDELDGLLPAGVTAILREYVLEPVPATQVQTEKLLQEAWRRAVQAQMLAGRIDATQESLLMQGGLCVLQAQSDCTELISRTLPLEAAD